MAGHEDSASGRARPRTTPAATAWSRQPGDGRARRRGRSLARRTADVRRVQQGTSEIVGDRRGSVDAHAPHSGGRRRLQPGRHERWPAAGATNNRGSVGLGVRRRRQGRSSKRMPTKRRVVHGVASRRTIATRSSRSRGSGPSRGPSRSSISARSRRWRPWMWGRWPAASTCCPRLARRALLGRPRRPAAPPWRFARATGPPTRRA